MLYLIVPLSVTLNDAEPQFQGHTDRPHIGKISNGHISAGGHPIDFMMFGPRVGFSGSVDRMALFCSWTKFNSNRYVGENNARGSSN